jgi:uracil-DNA glycosylase
MQLSAPRQRAVLCLGGLAWDAVLAAARELQWDGLRPKPRFGHAREFTATTPDLRAIRVVGCYHVSPHNTYTGRLTAAMLDEVLLSLRG